MTNGKSKQEAAHGHPPPNIGLYLGIFGGLLALTVLTVLVSYWHLPPAPAIFVGLLIALVKASLVAAFFMHLKGENKLIYYCLGIMCFCLIGFIIIPLDMHLIGDRTTHTAVAEAAEGSGAPEGAAPETSAPAEKPQEPAAAPAPAPAPKAAKPKKAAKAKAPK